jgi:hypothetical protein
MGLAILTTRNSVMISTGPKTPKMSERPLKTLKDFPTLWLATIYRADCAGTFARATWNIDLRAACRAAA